jgi:hypothetical protein
MKSNFRKIRGLTLLLIPALMLVAVGCNQIPGVGTYPAPNTSPNYSLIANFDGNLNSQPVNQTNSYLFELGAPGNKVVAPGTFSVVNNFTGINGNGVPYENAIMNITSGGAIGNGCFVTGFVNDTGNGTYPSVVLAATLDTSPPSFPVPAGQKSGYNASFFSGIKFYLNCKTDDNCAARNFYFATTQEAAAGNGGTCTAGNQCYNYFGYAYANTSGWQLVSLNFSQMTTSYGLVPTPPTLTGVNLEELYQLMWQEGDQNGGKSVNVDFAVDEVYFF